MSGLLRLFTAMAGLCFFAAGCGSYQSAERQSLIDNLPPPPPVRVHTTPVHQTESPPRDSEEMDYSSSSPLTLDKARQLTWARTPALAASWQEIQVQVGLRQQAGLPLNPELFAELEEFAGSRSFSGFNNASGRLGLSREIQTGEKQKLAIQAVTTELQAAIYEYQALQNELAILVETRFYAVFLLQQSLLLKQERLKSLEETGKVIQGRVKAGENSPLELLKHQSELADATNAVRKAGRELKTSRAILASTWGEAQPLFPAVEAEWQQIPPPALEMLQKALTASPAWQNSRLAINKAETELSLAESQKYPNFAVEGGIQHFREDDSWALFVGLSLPLPIFDRNQGNIAAAQAKLQQALAESAGSDLTLQNALRNAWQHWQDSAAALTELESETMPAAKNYYDAIYTAYQTGEADILELFDARQSWLAKREELLELRNECETARLEMLAHIAVNDLKNLTHDKE